MKKKRMLALTLAAVMGIGLLFTSCGNSNNNNNKKNEGNNNKSKVTAKNNEKDEKEDKKDKIDAKQFINVPLVEPKTLDPSRSSDLYSVEILTNSMDALTRIEQVGGKDVIVPGIAKEWSVSEDETTWTFKLRDALWSDGKEITAEDFEYAMKRSLDPKIAAVYGFILFPIKNAKAAYTGKVALDEVGVKAIDKKTLEIKLEAPTAYFLDLTYFKVMMPQRKDMVEKYGEAFGGEAEHMISNGAFKIVEWNHGTEIKLVKNDKYWNAENVIIENLNYKFIREEGARMNSLLSGIIDMGGVSQPNYRKMFDESGKFNYYSNPTPSTSYTCFNQRNKYFANAKIRKAFTLALNRDKYNEIINRGLMQSAYAFIPPTAQIGGEDFRTLVNKEPLKKLAEENKDPKQLLIEGLKELGEGEKPEDVTIKFLASGTSQRDKEVNDYLKNEYETVLGVNIEFENYEWAIYSQKSHKGEYEMKAEGWTGDYNDPMTFLDIFMTGSVTANTGWSNKEFDQCIMDAAATTDQAKRLELFKRAEEILLYEDAVISPSGYRKRSTYERNFIYGVMRPLFGATDFTRAFTRGR